MFKRLLMSSHVGLIFMNNLVHNNNHEYHHESRDTENDGIS